MLLHLHMEISNGLSLLVIMGFIGIGVLASTWSNRQASHQSADKLNQGNDHDGIAA